MSEQAITYLILAVLLCAVSFICGWFAAKYFSLKGRLASDNGVCTDNGNTIARTEERIESSEGRTQDLIGATESIADIIKRYENSAQQEQKLDEDMVHSCVDIDSD